jgi:hypothetical protein
VSGVLPRFADTIFKPSLTRSLFGSYSLGPQGSPLFAEINKDRLPEHRCRRGCQRDAMTGLQPSGRAAASMGPRRSEGLRYFRRGRAAAAKGDVISANDTSMDVRTSITVGTRAFNAATSAGPNAFGSVTRTPSQPIARAMAP